MPASKIPNTTPTRTRVRASTPATPIPIAAAKFDRPSDRATSTSASTRPPYPSRPASVLPGGTVQRAIRRETSDAPVRVLRAPRARQKAWAASGQRGRVTGEQGRRDPIPAQRH